MKDTVRVAAVGDLHCSRTSRGALQPLFAQMAESADVLAMCGDLLDHGLPEEAEILVAELAAVGKLPTVAVLGNHDYESGQVDRVQEILCTGGIQILSGDTFEIHGVGFAGTKGFGGGFGHRSLEPWGEQAIKAFVQEAVDEATRLGAALARLGTSHRIALLHYAPIIGTVEGEPLEIYPFLGSSRLEEPINRHEATVALHGHAHHGQPEGRTSTGIPVYNVSIPVLRTANPDRPPFRIIELTRDQEERQNGHIPAGAEAVTSRVS